VREFLGGDVVGRGQAGSQFGRSLTLPGACPTCTGPAMSKRQRFEWAFPRQPALRAQDLAQQSDHPLELFGHGQSPLTDMIVGKLGQPFPGSVDLAAIDH
jgi:hypothetical protein